MNLVKFNHRTRNAIPYFNDVFDSLFNDALNKSYNIDKHPSVNIHESEDAYHIELAAPGLSKEDFKIDLKKNNLSISVEKKSEKEEVEKNYSRKEFEYISFVRSFVMPDGIDQEKTSAEYVNGILHITVGKKQEVKETFKEIIVS